MTVSKLCLLLSVPTGYNARELLTPLREIFEHDAAIARVVCLTGAAAYRHRIFPTYRRKFAFVDMPGSLPQARECLQRERPAIVITPSTGLDPNDVPVLRAAKALKIPTLTFVSSWDNVFKMGRAIAWKRDYEIPDYVVVWNTMMRDHFTQLFPTFPLDHLKIIGPLRLDYYSRPAAVPSREALAAYLQVSPDDTPWLHISSTELYPIDYVVRPIAAATRQGTLPPVRLLVSVHPGGDIRRHQHLTTRYGATVFYSFGHREDSPHPAFHYNPTDEDILRHVALFRYSAMCINQSSTVSIESILCDVPVINVRYGKMFDWWRWRRSMVYRDFYEHFKDVAASGATTVVSNQPELLRGILAYVQNPHLHQAARRATAKKMITTIDGTAARQFVELMVKVATKRA